MVRYPPLVRPSAEDAKPSPRLRSIRPRVISPHEGSFRRKRKLPRNQLPAISSSVARDSPGSSLLPPATAPVAPPPPLSPSLSAAHLVAGAQIGVRTKQPDRAATGARTNQRRRIPQPAPPPRRRRPRHLDSAGTPTRPAPPRRRRDASLTCAAASTPPDSPSLYPVTNDTLHFGINPGRPRAAASALVHHPIGLCHNVSVRPQRILQVFMLTERARGT